MYFSDVEGIFRTVLTARTSSKLQKKKRTKKSHNSNAGEPTFILLRWLSDSKYFEGSSDNNKKSAAKGAKLKKKKIAMFGVLASTLLLYGPDIRNNFRGFR